MTSPERPLPCPNSVAHAILGVVGAMLLAAWFVAPAALAQGPVGPQLPSVTRPAATNPKRTTAARSRVASAKPSSRRTTSTARQPGFGVGARGPEVVNVQARLAALKYDVTDTSGAFGDQTHHAVMAFQKVNGLPRTGRVTPAMLAKLATATDPAPLLPTGGSTRIEIDLTNQFLALYKNGALFKLLSISSGSGKDFCVLDPETNKTACDKAITPGGSYRIRGRIIGWRESKLGLLYNPLYFNGGIAIHGAPSVPATPASHGCVRIPMISAEWFPSEVTDGTAVYVFGADDRAPVPLREKLPPGATTGGTTLPPPSTLPPQSTVSPSPGGTTPPGVTTTTLVHILGTTVPTPTPGTTPPAPTTVAPTTVAPTTVAPTTIAPTTAAPTSAPG